MAASGFEPGMVVAGYRLERLLGHGGMGVVYEATQISLDRTVALKIVAPGLGADITFRTRFQREGMIQARLDHPNIVTVYEAGEVEGTLFLAMHLVRGGSLKDMIIGRELDPGRSLRLLGPVADALDSAHEAGLIHRDVKPHNILVGARDHPYLADFGLTKGVDATGLTRTGQFLGSLDYISPEQISGEPATPASDIYALGAVLFECLAGVVPYPRESDAAVLYAHVAEKPPQLTTHRPALPAALDAVVARAMAKEPSGRYASAVELIEEATRAFSGPTRDAMQVPAPAQTLVELGIRPPEGEVDTVRAAAQDPEDLARRAAPTSAPAPGAGASTQLAATELAASAPPAGSTAAAAPAPATAAARAPAAPTHAAEDSAPARARRLRRPVSRDRGSARALAARRRVGALVALVALGVAGGAFALGHSGGGGGSSGERAQSATAGPVKLAVPAAWRQATSPPSLSGLPFSDEVAYEQPSSGGVMIAGVLPGAEGERLLPSAFLARLHTLPATNDTVRLGDGLAYRYRDLSVSGLAGPVTLLVAPSSKGVIGIGCLAPATGAVAFRASCENVAGSFELASGKLLPLGPDPSFGRVLADAVARLQAAQGTARRLATARTRAGQASLSASLASGYAGAASKLATGRPGPQAAPANAHLLAAVRGAATGYGAMSSAARAGRAKAFSAARDSTARNLTRIDTQLAALRAIGYGG
ncbi:MAG: serine/threonine protein kinase [Solirubrobacterales bacterium]|nr:serine/threonine protein kinase [Solirubrobacterales bacterium]